MVDETADDPGLIGVKHFVSQGFRHEDQDSEHQQDHRHPDEQSEPEPQVGAGPQSRAGGFGLGDALR
ncbi:hypothetical protein ABZ485_12750 [Streptomyces albogriseolus]|uniref:hypothetical protein n=1 Tax=Streptomyces albogriseolus TaxID=1887 RepID=UPI0034610A72